MGGFHLGFSLLINEKENTAEVLKKEKVSKGFETAVKKKGLKGFLRQKF